jgi:pyruvate dehydrogenase E1 component alpha subunit
MASAKGKSKTEAAPTASGEELLKHYRAMLLIRRFEERAGQLYGMGLIGGFCHLYIGQEAVVVGMQAALEPGDTVVTSYRDHGHMLACGMDPRGVMAELTGRSGGYSKGKGGSMHMFSREKNFFGGHGIVGAQVPIGTGLAFAHRYGAKKLVSVTYLGDGAVNQGQVAESFNMAALWKLPVIYVIENNKYGMGTSVSRAAAGGELYKRGEPYGIPGMAVDGMDVVAVKDAGIKAAAHARAGEGPFILEMMTYRYRGHSMSDPAKYRPKEEVNEMRTKHDPIDHVRQLMVDGGLSDDDKLKAIDKETRDIIADAAEFAQASPEPDPAQLYTDVLVGA